MRRFYLLGVTVLFFISGGFVVTAQNNTGFTAVGFAINPVGKAPKLKKVKTFENEAFRLNYPKKWRMLKRVGMHANWAVVLAPKQEIQTNKLKVVHLKMSSDSIQSAKNLPKKEEKTEYSLIDIKVKTYPLKETDLKTDVLKKKRKTDSLYRKFPEKLPQVASFYRKINSSHYVVFSRYCPLLSVKNKQSGSEKIGLKCQPEHYFYTETHYLLLNGTIFELTAQYQGDKILKYQKDMQLIFGSFRYK